MKSECELCVISVQCEVLSRVCWGGVWVSVCVYLCLCVYESLSISVFQLPRYSATPPTKVVLQRRQFSSSSSPDTPRIKLHYDVASSHLPAPQILRVLQLYYRVTRYSAYYSCTTESPVLIFQRYQVASSHLPPQILRDSAY